MGITENPAPRFGLPSPETLRDYRIWDAYFTPAHAHPGDDGASRMEADIARSWRAIEIGQIEKLCYFAHVGLGTTGDPSLEARLLEQPQLVTAVLDKWPGRLLGMIQLNAARLADSLAALDRWLGDGPMLGVYFPGGGPGAVTCTHRNFIPLVQRVAELRGVIVQHTWYKTGGKQGPGESTPAELVRLAKHFPEQQFVCAHAGGEWERGIRAVVEQENVHIETSGFDATAGFVEMAVRELGAERIIFGSHLPSRSLGTELSKVIGAEITESQKRLILGENFRRLLAPELER